jgi:putative FmdB family regulatory protein
VPFYEFRCPTCATSFDLRRTMAEADDPATCPDGHTGAVRQMSRVLAVTAVSSGSSGSAGSSAGTTGAPRMGGGGCGSGCGCAH